MSRSANRWLGFHQFGVVDEVFIDADAVAWARWDLDLTLLALKRRGFAVNRDFAFALELLVGTRVLNAGGEVADVNVA